MQGDVVKFEKYEDAKLFASTVARELNASISYKRHENLFAVTVPINQQDLLATILAQNQNDFNGRYLCQLLDKSQNNNTSPADTDGDSEALENWYRPSSPASGNNYWPQEVNGEDDYDHFEEAEQQEELYGPIEEEYGVPYAFYYDDEGFEAHEQDREYNDKELREEAEDWQDSYGRSDESGWFYSDDEDDWYG